MNSQGRCSGCRYYQGNPAPSSIYFPHASFSGRTRKEVRKRHSESSADLALRLERAKGEIKSLPIFDYVITSRQNKLDEVVSQIDAIVAAEKRRVKPRIVEL